MAEWLKALRSSREYGVNRSIEGSTKFFAKSAQRGKKFGTKCEALSP